MGIVIPLTSEACSVPEVPKFEGVLANVLRDAAKIERLITSV